MSLFDSGAFSQTTPRERREYETHRIDPDAAEAAAEQGQDEALDAPRVELWRHYADEFLRECPAGAEFTADDLIATIGLPDVGVNRNNVVGAWFGAKRRAGEIEATGERRRSSRVVRHGNDVRVWRVCS